ncbi:uncharacterized protein BT62DRAFT_612549 [Guyanagaster necrorhizus]|uniref:Uncharacterized protein n=1 Tax=Guyanagaster necrorhizus TaxID=856835 RepID=A0A9P7VZL1_9AGAR|nr:uncharacterized protein BT62DRAFT_612549 [Guyanagaster necrorhizus MCA 3950]KAG7449882.1 hypothetical protein BT62DRAFT_612549 [Guyanagaster necrorhizus MCA 3950]
MGIVHYLIPHCFSFTSLDQEQILILSRPSWNGIFISKQGDTKYTSYFFTSSFNFLQGDG